MKRYDVIRIANEVGINRFLNTESHIIGNFLESFANRIAEVEREACARLCEKENEEWGLDADVIDVAEEIRARG